MGWTLTRLDTNGRAVSVTHYAGSGLPSAFGGSNSSTTGAATTAYSGYTTTVTDEAGVTRASQADGLGRLKQVTENGSITTTYAYDALDDLTGVTQPADGTHSSGESRSFSYSSLKLLTSATNPENATISYTYDANGNLATRTQAGVTTSYAYDALDELTGKTYSAGTTPAASFGYTKGWKMSESSGSTSTSFTYEGLGRLQTSTQTTSGTAYPFQYTWNLADGLKTETYPSGRVVTTSRDVHGRPSQVTGSLGGGNVTYANSLQYATTGAMTQWTGGDGLTRTFGYNARLQVTSVTAGSLLTLGIGYSATSNNGNVTSKTITRPGISVSQTFGYGDGMGRLTSAAEGSNWTQTYQYDVEGNRALYAGSSVIASGLTPQTSSTSSVPYNDANQWGGAGYTNGNLTSLSGQTMTYDNEQRLAQWLTSGPPTTTVTFSYDANGRRTAQTVGSATTVYVYDGTGALAAEYGITAPMGTMYLTADQLGSTRLVTDGSGNAVGCHDYLPFGEEIPQGWGRVSVACYGTSGDVDLRFTGQVRDSNTGLDYFGARYMSSAQGRFTSPDPITGTPLHIINPQRWNMYAYVVNNPLAFIDPSGMDAIAVNFSKEIPLGGHEGIISVHADGTAEYARFGPVGGSKPFGEGQVDTQNLNPVQFGSDGLPTDAAYKALTQQVAGFEHQDPSTVRMNYFKTSEADTLALDAWIKRIKDASNRRQAPTYDVTRQNCATFCIVGLIQGNAIQNRGISLIPNRLFDLLSGVSTENYSNGQRTPKEVITEKICYTDENGKQVCQ